MVTILSLWLPILLSAVLVFITSSLIHMFLNYHANDFSRIPDEDKVRDAFRPFQTPPGNYVIPFAASKKELRSEEFNKKVEDGPLAYMTVLSKDDRNMGKPLVLWFVYCIIVGTCAAYLTGRAVGPDAHYLEVFRFAGCTAFIGYSLALMQNAIWYKESWSATLKSMFDGFIYALLTAGCFGWLW